MTSSTTAAIRQALGAYGETLAMRHLVDQGMVLLDRNWRCDAGEIDLVWAVTLNRSQGIGSPQAG